MDFYGSNPGFVSRITSRPGFANPVQSGPGFIHIMYNIIVSRVVQNACKLGGVIKFP